MSADLEAEVLALLREHNDSLPRSQQVELGWSGVGGDCDRETWSTVTGQPRVNATKILAGMRGHAIHAYLAPIFEAAGWESEVPVEYAGIPGSADLYRDGVVADLKTGDAAKVRSLRTYGPDRSWRWQIQGYARALAEKGRDVHTVRIIAISYDSSEEVAVWQEPYNAEIADDAVEHVVSLSLLSEAPAPSRFPDYCEHWCSFYDETGERGCPSLAPSSAPELTDPRLIQAVADFDAHKKAEKAAKEAKAAAASVLADTYGQAGGIRVKTIVRGDGEEVDVQALLDFWNLVNGEPPKRRTSGYSYVDVRPVAKEKKAKADG